MGRHNISVMISYYRTQNQLIVILSSSAKKYDGYLVF